MVEESKFRKAVKWAYIMNWGEQGLAAVFSFVLGYLLGPSDFGVVAMAMVYILFAQMLLEQGLAAALIQRRDLREEHLNSVFWMDMIVSFVLVVLSTGLGRLWAAANHTPILYPVIAALSLGIPIEGLTIVQRAVLSREMDFRSLSIRSNVSVIVGGILGLIMAFKGFGIWALVGQRLCQDFAALVLLWGLSHWRPKIQFSLPSLKELWGFSLANLLSKIGTFANQHAEVLLMGMFFGPEAVGLYRMADKLKGVVLTATTRSLQTVSLPEFSRHQDRPARLRQSMISCLRLSSIFSLPAMAGLWATSQLLMSLLGAKWMLAAQVLKVLCLVGMIMAFIPFIGALLQAINRPHLAAVMTWANAAVSVAALLASAMLLRNASIRGQVVGVAVARLGSCLIFFVPFFFYVLIRFCGIQTRDFFRTIIPAAAAAFVAGGVPWLAMTSGMLGKMRPTLALAIVVLAGGAASIVTLLKFDSHLRKIAFDYLSRFATALRLEARSPATASASKLDR
jgi:O-antigen/teichoic acid export membrane protein